MFGSFSIKKKSASALLFADVSVDMCLFSLGIMISKWCFFFFWKWENKSSVAFVIYSRPGFRNLEICSEERCVANLSLEIHPYCWHLIILLFYFSVDAFHMCSPVLCDKHWGSWMQRKTPVAKVILQMDIDLCTRTVDRSTDPLQSHTGIMYKSFPYWFLFFTPED